jgi:hypothetical protein
LRPYSLITVEDQIVYQAAANVVADAMLPRIRSRYLHEVFGHLYAGRSSPWFYRKWADGYKQFNAAAIAAFNSGLEFTASFDLTACYDSIDHGVLCHFLGKLRLSREFCALLSSWLTTWTATDTDIRHNHGIPQGPLPSGLIAETVLGHFDTNRRSETSVRYLRYVDDIRLFARREQDLRKMLVRLDRLSKDIGLFPQSGKIEIHKVRDIRDELKTVSQPGERLFGNPALTQSKVRRRIRSLTRRFEVKDPTRFKFVVSSATPSAEISKRLMRVHKRSPIFYDSICRYLSRYEVLPVNLVEHILGEIRAQALYPAIQASFIHALNSRVPVERMAKVRSALKQMWHPKILQADLAGAILRYLLPQSDLSDAQILYAAERARSWWVRAEVAFSLPAPESNPAATKALNLLICDPIQDPAAAAAWVCGRSGTVISALKRDLAPGAKHILREFGLVRRGGRRVCGIRLSLIKMTHVDSQTDWRKFFRANYRSAERQMVEARAYSETNATAWVNSIDVFNDWLLMALYGRYKTLGQYNPGTIGSVMDSVRLAKSFPAVSRLVREIHQKRHLSNLSHAKVRKSGKATSAIRFSFLRNGKKLLRGAVMELEATA